MPYLSLLSLVMLYALLALITPLVLVLLWWQIQVLYGKRMPSSDGSFDDWHETKVHFGHAVADIFFACPVGIGMVVLILVNSPWGFYLLPMIGFWFVYANTFTTATSLRFQNPKPKLIWFIEYPLGILVGLGVLAWTAIHFDIIYSS